MGVSEPTVRTHLDLLADALTLRQLQPWHANLRKRQVKSPKVYVRDRGLLHEQRGIEHQAALLHHPKLGASWEGFAIEQVLATEPHTDASFWATHRGAEIGLLLRRRGSPAFFNAPAETRRSDGGSAGASPSPSDFFAPPPGVRL